jgi:membrane protease YdiL (CAAX protease family)
MSTPISESDPDELVPSSPQMNADAGPIRGPRVWPVFVIYVLLIILQVVVAGAVLVVIAVRSQGGWDMTPESLLASARSPAGLLGSAALGLLIVGGGALISALLSRVPWRERLRLRFVDIGPLNVILGCVCVLAVGFVLQGLDSLGWLPHSVTLEAVDGVIRELKGRQLFAAVIIIGILPGIAEELLFRGYIQTRLCERWGTNWGIAVTAVMFGVMHMDLVQGTYAMVIGILLGFLAARTGSIIPGIICHAVNNTISTLLSASNVSFEGSTAGVVSLAVGILVTAASIAYLRRSLPHAERRPDAVSH